MTRRSPSWSSSSSWPSPAADHLHALVTCRPEFRVRHGERGAPRLGGPLKALARAGDPGPRRCCPRCWPVRSCRTTWATRYPTWGLRPCRWLPLCGNKLARVPLDGPDTYERAAPLLSALTALGDAESIPAVLRLLRGMPDGLRPRDAVARAAVRALGGFGGAAYEAIPDLRGLLETDGAVAAAEALWSITGEPDAVVPVLLRELTGIGSDRRRRAAAADALARLGLAGPSGPARAAADGGSDAVRERATAACAVWRIAGEPEQFLPVLRSAWAEDPRTRTTVAGCLAALGPAGAPLHDLLRAELASPRRHRADARGCGSSDIHEDEGLLRVCRAALAGVGHV